MTPRRSESNGPGNGTNGGNGGPGPNNTKQKFATRFDGLYLFTKFCRLPSVTDTEVFENRTVSVSFVEDNAVSKLDSEESMTKGAASAASGENFNQNQINRRESRDSLVTAY